MEEEQLKQQISSALTRAAPPGWVANLRLQDRYSATYAEEVRLSHLEWKMAPQQQGRGLMNDYLLRVSMDQRLLMILHGNSDAGPGPSPFVRATLIYPAEGWSHEERRGISISDAISRILSDPERFPPNRWGLS